MLVHPIPPLYNSESRVLILGSFPSVKSREQGFFYGHKQNRFWRVMARICNADLPMTIDEKTRLILDNHFALWDVIHSCDIEGSADSTIKNVKPNDLSVILDNANIKMIFVNGKKAESLYKKYIEPELGIKAICLPSTSPANASWSEDRLYEYWNEMMGDILMNKDFIVMQTNLLVNAPSCCDEAKKAGNDYLNAIGTDNEQECLDTLVKELKADIIPIDNMVAFLKTDASKLVFGEKRDFFLNHALELEKAGVKYCDCPACSAGEAIIKAYEE